MENQRLSRTVPEGQHDTTKRLKLEFDGQNVDQEPTYLYPAVRKSEGNLWKGSIFEKSKVLSHTL